MSRYLTCQIIAHMKIASVEVNDSAFDQRGIIPSGRAGPLRAKREPGSAIQ